MKIGMVGLGKLGLPCLLAMEKFGSHEVYGFDISQNVIDSIESKKVNYWEAGVNELLQESKIKVVPKVSDLVDKCDIIFVAVQTPHDPAYEGKTPLPKNRIDFNYSNLESAIDEISQGLSESASNPLIVVISTVLPGTMRTRVFPRLEKGNKNFRFIYNPYFIAMGTTIDDFMNPEFILLGGNSEENLEEIKKFYSFVTDNCMPMDIESAELTKVAYNTFIGLKIIFANAISEIVSVRGGNSDAITKALSSAGKRLMSGQYMTAGMGDGGGCHPRDQIAMSWLAQEVNMSIDIFEFIASARDLQTLRQAEIIKQHCEASGWEPILLGLSYKPNSPLDVGSPARLLENYLKNMNFNLYLIDPWIYPENNELPQNRVYFVSSRHDEFKDLSKIEESIIIDPWRFVEKTHPTSKLIKIGINIKGNDIS
jgi:UDPglucose 6-dehydrogenase